MLKIGEFSELVRVSPRMLRHYEKCGLLQPAKIDVFTGYRYYNTSQIPLLLNIVVLRDIGFSIEEIGDILPHFNDNAYMNNILMVKSKSIKTTIKIENEKMQKIGNMRRELIKVLKDNEREIILKELPSVKVLAYRTIIKSYSYEFLMWERLISYIDLKNIVYSSSEEHGFTIYHDDFDKESNVDIEIAISVNNSGTSDEVFIYKELGAIPLAATLRFSGPYDGYTKAVERLMAWIEQMGYEICGLIRGVIINVKTDKSNFQNLSLTEIQIPVKIAES
jgi:DNA-binding transcriptional MerR regulator